MAGEQADAGDEVGDLPIAPAQSFEEWYQHLWPKLVAYVAISLNGDVQAAEDVAGEAMARAYARWNEQTIAQPSAWVFKVAANLVRRAGRRRALERALRPKLYERAEFELSPVSDPELAQAISGLPERQRKAIVLRYVADLTQAEVAKAMGVADGTAASLLHGGRQRLRASLETTHKED